MYRRFEFIISGCGDSILIKFVLIYFKLGAGMTMPNWDFTGSTMVTPNYVRLTPDVQSKSGALWNLAVCALFYSMLTMSKEPIFNLSIFSPS